MTIAILLATTLLLVYVFIVRPLLKTQPILSDAFKAEASLIDKIRAKVTGWRTRIVARLIWIGGLLVGLYDQILPLAMGQDWTPLTDKLPGWSLPVGMLAVGFLVMKLKTMTQNAPQVIIQKDETGAAMVVDVQPFRKG